MEFATFAIEKGHCFPKNVEMEVASLYLILFI